MGGALIGPTWGNSIEIKAILLAVADILQVDLYLFVYFGLGLIVGEVEFRRKDLFFNLGLIEQINGMVLLEVGKESIWLFVRFVTYLLNCRWATIMIVKEYRT